MLMVRVGVLEYTQLIKRLNLEGLDMYCVMQMMHQHYIIKHAGLFFGEFGRSYCMMQASVPSLHVECYD